MCASSFRLLNCLEPHSVFFLHLRKCHLCSSSFLLLDLLFDPSWLSDVFLPARFWQILEQSPLLNPVSWQWKYLLMCLCNKCLLSSGTLHPGIMRQWTAVLSWSFILAWKTAETKDWVSGSSTVKKHKVAWREKACGKVPFFQHLAFCLGSWNVLSYLKYVI